MSLREEILESFPRLRTLAGSCRNVYVGGGAGRDLRRGARPADVDIASDDPLSCARSLKLKVIRLGRDHLSAWRVPDGEHVYDFAELLDGNIVADLARRDFTVNAMAVDLATGELHDPHGGRRDLERRVVRMIDPSNFDDDPLRMLKAVRMAVVLDFSVDLTTREAICARAPSIASVAAERVTYELSLILSALRFRKAIDLLRATGLDAPLGLRLPPVAHGDDVPLEAALAILVDDPRSYGERWRWSEMRIRDVIALQRLTRDHRRVALFRAGERVASQLPAMLQAMGRSDTVDLPDFTIRPLLDGEEIAAACGVTPGPRLGRIKSDLVDAQVSGEVRTRDEAVAFVRARPV